MRETSEEAEELLLEAAYRAELGGDTSPNDDVRVVGGRKVTTGELRAYCLDDLARRVTESSLLRRADDTARIAALRFVERRIAEGNKIAAFGRSGSFQGFLRKVISNLLLDWLRSPEGKAELSRTPHDVEQHGGARETDEELPSEATERERRLMLHHLVAIRALRSLPPGRGVPLRLALWPDYPHDDDDVATIGAFAHCHETADGQAEARACDAGKRCTRPSERWRRGWERELETAKESEPSGLSRKNIALLTRIGHGKPMAKREGAICERISKARLELVAELRRVGIKGTTT